MRLFAVGPPLAASLCAILIPIAIPIAQPRAPVAPPPAAASASWRMSFHNRLLLNRAAVTQQKAIEVMLLAGAGRLDEVMSAAASLGARVRALDPAIGYARVEIATDRLLLLVNRAGVDAYQIASASKSSWYRDGPPQVNAEMHRGFEIGAPPPAAPAVPGDLPPLSAEQARQRGFTADGDAGVRRWLDEHPHADGRGVTIALLENGLAEFSHPIFGRARTLDGREVPKLAGIRNTIDVEAPDETRVRLSTEVHATSTWRRIGRRTYILPRPGSYRFGLYQLPAATSLVHEFGVVEDLATGDILLDTNGDADFRNELPLVDVNVAFSVRHLELLHPRPRRLAFVMARGTDPHTVHVYAAVGSHQTMTVSVAAGSAGGGSVASGVAPGARVLLIRTHTPDYRLVDLIEGYLAAARMPEVDLLSDSSGITMVPDTAADFAALFLSRLIAVYRKPIFHAAGNLQLLLNSASSLGDAFAVGGSLGGDTLAALYGGTLPGGLSVHPVSAGGPALDGAIKPDFLAPMNLVAADLMEGGRAVAVPRSVPSARLPPGHRISCCTSASSPYAAGAAALLLSRAKQEGRPYTAARLAQALRFGARFLPGWPAHEQGHGVLDLQAAWLELARDAEPLRIRTDAPLVHPLAQYAARASRGSGIFERDGWTAGMSRRRDLTLTRETGPRDSITYRVGWLGNDGTFAAPPAIALPRASPVILPVTIAPTSPGAHSAILNLHDSATGAVASRTQTTVVAAESFDRTGTARLAGTVQPMRGHSRYVRVPPDAAAMLVELEVLRGSLRAVILPAHGLLPNYQGHLHPSITRTYVRGRYRVALPRPAAGTWTIGLLNDSLWREINPALVSSEPAGFVITLRLLRASVDVRSGRGAPLDVVIRNHGATLREPVVQTTPATLRSHRARFLPTGLPNIFDITVPKGASALALQLRSAGRPHTGLELYLYDCTSGECFAYDFTLPAAAAHTRLVRRPSAGRWVVAVNAAPDPYAADEFVLDEIVALGEPRLSRSTHRPQPTGAAWTQQVEPGEGVLLIELIDLAVDRDESSYPWDPRPGIPILRDRPVGIGFKGFRGSGVQGFP